MQEEFAILGIEADHIGRKYIGGEVRRESQNVLAGLVRNAALAIGCHGVSTRILLPVFQIARGARCNENKKLAGSIASPANEIVACRYTIRKRRCLAPAAPAPGCTATCTSYAYANAWHALSNQRRSHHSRHSRRRIGRLCSPRSRDSHRIRGSHRIPGQPHPRQPPHPPHPRWASCTPLRTIFFVVEEMEGSKADVGNFLFTERDHHARSEIRPLNIGRRYGRCICTSC